MPEALAFAAGFLLAWWYRPKWMLSRLRRFVRDHDA